MKNDDPTSPDLGWSDFARRRYVPGSGHAYYDGTAEELLDLVRAGWADREPGQGRSDLAKVVVVPVPPEGFVGSTVLVDEGMALGAELMRRQAGEEPYVQVTAAGPTEKVRFARVVLYSAAALLENDGRRSGNHAWEVVALLATADANEPMDPLTMARNMLAKPGGTPCEYTAAEFAEAVWYWARRAQIGDRYRRRLDG